MEEEATDDRLHLACLIGWTGGFGIALSTAHSLATDFNGGHPPTQNQHVLPQGQASTSQRLIFEVGAPVKGTKDGFVDTNVGIDFLLAKAMPYSGSKEWRGRDYHPGSTLYVKLRTAASSKTHTNSQVAQIRS